MVCGKKSALEGQEVESKARCFWTLDDETHLIQYIAAHHAKGGDRMNFDKTFWTAASIETSKHTTQGAPKTINACQSKWAWLHSTFSVVDSIATYSGWEYSLERGANVTAESEMVWTDYMGSSKAPLTAKKFKNKGWPHYEAMKELLPSAKTHGSRAFYTCMPADNAALVGASSHATSSHLPDGMSYDEANILDQEEALNDIESQDVDIAMMPPPSTIMTEPPSPFNPMQRPTFTPSTPGTSTIASGKQKAAGESGDNMRSLARPPGSTKSASESGKSVKSPRVAVPEAFQSMSKEIHNLSTSFDRATDVMHERATQVASRPTVDPIPVRKQKAIIQLQKEGLEDHEIIEIIKHFQADVSIADSYLVIEKESVRKLFLSTYLK
ncbi:uncharacterized protein F5891DRAFT_987277 [Suillus fuscotomentosus]|uniref:Myb/SANT-like domain-containing protein n=1 Tax=Suillus fuscotomentosus TaxID=1912939 RepID=A0AAD4HCX4_9AGAM|nr:uncharacterized protein F5891DRAFT_987277 [Suillus fuscotomentosus]KAG1889688.1 hypothetical protein F5891DRAFT_987277 [Suillus fuscotomentosus]